MGRNVCILLPHGGVYPALGAMLHEVFSDLGWQATVRNEADTALLEQDLLLLAGLCRHVDGLPDLLRQRQGQKPVTVLWQLEPLPPAELSLDGERIGLRATAFDWRRMPRAAQKALGYVAPLGKELARLGRRGLALAYSRQVIHEPNHQGWVRYHVSNYLAAVSEWRWIKPAHANGWLDHYFASTQPRVRFLRSRGISAEMLPVGYHRDWGRDLGANRDIDVLFLGSMGRRRRGANLRWLQEELARRGRTLTFAVGAYGAAREELLNRARIVLSLLRMPHDLAGIRVLMGMACGALVVSEYCHDTDAYRPGEHFVMAELNQLPKVIDYYLEHEEERKTIAWQGHRFVTEELTLANLMHKMLRQIETAVTR